MAITPPSKGSPVDVDLLAQIVNEINDLRRSISGDTSVSQVDSMTVDTFGKLCFLSKKQGLSVKTIAENQKETVVFTFNDRGVQFRGTPNVTVGVRNVGGTEGGWHVIPVIDNITDAGCSIALTFKKADEKEASLEICIIAIGIAN